MSYYHGGPSGLSEILPPALTGASSVSEYGAAHVHSREHCYVTTSSEAAAMFAAMTPAKSASVYEVDPVGMISPDPDCSEPGLSWRCRSAKVLSEFRIPVAIVNRIRKEMGK